MNALDELLEIPTEFGLEEKFRRAKPLKDPAFIDRSNDYRLWDVCLLRRSVRQSEVDD